MNTLKNKVQLIGRLGAKAELKSTAGGKVFTRVSMATNEIYKDANGGKVKQTTWHNLVAWGKTAEIISKYTEKGSEVTVEGKLINREYVGKDGVKRQTTEVQVTEVLLSGNKSPAV
ncbi:MAG TPA: single-stranded DNA-binding protein [Cyclobacteriaceae bacterium]|nr:single-stranded DNA-binding protein [Cyclobacteriaceae bacterium]